MTAAPPASPRRPYVAPFRIRTKLFIVLVSVNALLALGIYVISSWNFERQFRDYIVRQENVRLDRLARALAAGYAQNGRTWTWIERDRGHWFRLLRENLSVAPPLPPDLARESGASDDDPGPGDARAPGQGPRDRPPEEGRQRPGGESSDGSGPLRKDRVQPGQPMEQHGAWTLSPFILLFDADRHLIEGPPGRAEPGELWPIELDGKAIGYLGFTRRTELVQAMDRLFAEQQQTNFVIIALGMIIAAVIVAAGIAYALSRPIRALAAGTHQLTEGNFAARTPVKSADELGELAHDFNVLAETLEANRDAQKRWLADIAHELRTPLSVLQGEVEAMQDGIRPMARETIASLSQEVARMSRLVEDLRTLSMSDAGAFEYRNEAVDVNALVSRVIETHAAALQEADIAARIELAGDNWIYGDPGRLAQLLENLMQNTRRYTDPPGMLHVSVKPHGAAGIALDWKDSSPGVSDEDLPALSRRFFRVESMKSRDSGGEGIGLAIVRAIVEAHHGSIEPRHSDLGGVWWHIRFPRIGSPTGAMGADG